MKENLKTCNHKLRRRSSIAEDTRNRTGFILNSLLVFGLLENRDIDIPKTELAEILRIEHENQVARYIKHLRSWLSDEAGRIIRGGMRGYVLEKGSVSNDSYEDFLTTLLVLNLVDDRPEFSILPLMNKRRSGVNVMGIIATLILARDNGSKLVVHYGQGRDREEFEFRPGKIILRNGNWLVMGVFRYPGPRARSPLEISEIRAVEFR